MGFSRQEDWSGLPFPSPGDLPDPGIEPESPVLQADFFPSDPPWKPQWSQIQHDPRVLVGSSVSSRQDHPSEAPSYTCKEAVLVTVPGQGLQTRVVRSR